MLSTVMGHFTSHLHSTRTANVSTPSSTCAIHMHLIVTEAFLESVRWYHPGFHLPFLMTGNIEHLITLPFGHLFILIGDMSSKSYVHFEAGCVTFLLWICRSSLFSGDTRNLPNTWLTNIFPVFQSYDTPQKTNFILFFLRHSFSV